MTDSITDSNADLDVLDPGTQEAFMRSGCYAVRAYRDMHGPDIVLDDAVIATLWDDDWGAVFRSEMHTAAAQISEATRDAARAAFRLGASAEAQTGKR